MDLKRSEYGRIEGETLPGDQQHGEGISMRARNIDIVDIRDEDRTGPSHRP